MYEDWGDGNGWLWWTIFKLDTVNQIIAATGNMGGGALFNEVWFSVHAERKQSLLRIKEIVTGAIDDRASLKEGQVQGWNELFRDAFKPYVERRSLSRSSRSRGRGGAAGRATTRAQTRNPRTPKRAGVRVD
jgi:hypothetical protein